MAGRGEKLDFHGAFGSKEAAKRKEKSVGGGIITRKVKGHTRHIAVTEKSADVVRFKG
jgi:hypothetical protein